MGSRPNRNRTLSAMQTMIARAVSFLAVTNRRKSVDHRSVFEDDAKPIESACGIWQVLFKAFGDYYLRVAYRLSQDQHGTAPWRINWNRFPSHDTALNSRGVGRRSGSSARDRRTAAHYQDHFVTAPADRLTQNRV
jgi:hypothetical protein